MDREERAAWRVAQKFHAEEKKRADEIRMAEIAAEAQEKNRADEIKVQMAQIEVDRELKLKEMKLQAHQAQAQANTSSATTPPPRNKDAKSLKLHSFIDEKDELDSYQTCGSEENNTVQTRLVTRTPEVAAVLPLSWFWT